MPRHEMRREEEAAAMLLLLLLNFDGGRDCEGCSMQLSSLDGSQSRRMGSRQEGQVKMSP